MEKSYSWSNVVSTPHAVAITIHGLNTAPQKMIAIAEFLAQNNARVLNVSLTGHRGDFEEFKRVDRDQWLNECEDAYKVAQAEAKRLNVPLYLIGFSLGALAYLDLMSRTHHEAGHFDKMVLFAPAIATHWYTRLILALGILGNGHIVPSRSPAPYRANPGTSVAAYRALFASKDALLANAYRNLNIPTLVFISADDELVSARGIQSIIKKYRLTRWDTRFVDNRQGVIKPHFHHLIIDEDSAGTKQWQSIKKLIQDHFDLH